MNIIEDNHPEPHSSHTGTKLNWLRASVLGANDGIVSIAGLVVGVAGAINSKPVILAAGMAGIIAGAISMAAGEYVSVSSSRDTEKALLKKERYELEKYPKEELEELALIYQRKGLSKATSLVVARELSAHDAFAAHAEAELGIDPKNLMNPWHAALASAASFIAGALIPMVAILIPSDSMRIPFAFVSVVAALAITGTLSALAGSANVLRATFRVILGGVIAMIATYYIGKLFGAAGF